MNHTPQLGILGPFGYVLVLVITASCVFSLTSLIQTTAFRRRRSPHLLWLGVVLPPAVSTLGALACIRRILHYTRTPALDWPFAGILGYACFITLSGLCVALLGCAAHITGKWISRNRNA